MKKKLDLEEIQKCELDILKEFILFLQKNNIEYYIWAGTLLGSVRHKGFIPWDDDIDIAIKRNDYKKMIELLKENNKLNDKFEAIGFELGNSDQPIIKIINNNIIVKDKYDIDKNLWIDVFPIDGIPNNKLYYYKVRFLWKLYSWKREEERNVILTNNKLKRYIKMIISKFVDFKTITQKYINMCSKYDLNDTEFAANIIWGVGKKEFFPKYILNESQKYIFEDIEVNGIKNYDKWLSIRYGDYMTIPPENKRITHSFDAWVMSDE